MAPSANQPTLDHSFVDVMINALKTAKSQIPRLDKDAELLVGTAKGLLNNGQVDPKELLLEGLIDLSISLPPGPDQGFATSKLLGSLWNNLKHPPLSYLGDQFKYRQADGSNNNIMYPSLGKGGSHYARSVVPKHVPTVALPDPALIFEELMERKGPAKQHPAQFSSLAIALATVIIHDIFRTDSRDETKLLSSSYLDLGPLYGHDQEMQNTLRQFKDGLIKPDTFTEVRLLSQPPAVGALLVSFNRFHNYVATELALINENGRFSIPSSITPENQKMYSAAEVKRDNDLFQTARLVTCGLYINIILKDYVRVILNLNRSKTDWSLDPRADFVDVFDAEGIPKGIGNQVSMEFNIIYRWHPTVSDKNAAWSESFLEKLFPGKDVQSLTQAEFLNGIRAWATPLAKQDPSTWTFGEMVRNENGSFNDEDLVKLLSDETEDCAGSFGARNTPTILKAVEILGIEQGRRYGAASLNELRNFFGLTSHKTFSDINSDPEVAASLEALYAHPDNVEMYPGLMVEEAKPLITNASGLCAGETIAKSILSDAVSLVRGDRFYTIDNSPANLTAFGYKDIASEMGVAQGVTIHKLLHHAYPGWYSGNSVYAMFPLTVPSEARKILNDLGLEQDFTYDPPSKQKAPIPVTTWQGIVNVFEDQTNFRVPWGPKVFDLTHRDWMLSGDKAWNAEQKSICKHALYSPKPAKEEFQAAFEQITDNLIKKHSHKLRSGYHLDAVRDVGNLSHAIFMAQLWHIPLTGDFAAKDLHDAFTAVFQHSFLDLDPSISFALRQNAREAATKLTEVITPAVEKLLQHGFHPLSMIEDALGVGQEPTALHEFGAKYIKRIAATGKDMSYIADMIVPTAAAGGPLPAQGFAMLLDFWLDPANASHWEGIKRLAQDDTTESLQQIRKYVLESLRINCTPAYGVFRTCATPTATIIDGSRTITVKQGDTIFLDFLHAGTDPTKFPNPLEIKLDRPEEDYIHQGWGAHECLGREITFMSLAVQLRAFARLKGLRRAGLGAKLKWKYLPGTTFKVFLNESLDAWTPFPRSLPVVFDGF